MAREPKYLLRKSNYSKGERHFRNARYHDDRTGKHNLGDLEDLPQHKGMNAKRKGNWVDGVDTSLVKRWLYSQVGRDFDQVYSDFLKRVQPKYLDTHRDCIYRYVVRKEFVVIQDGVPYEDFEHSQGHLIKIGSSRWNRFYVHPDTNILHVVQYKRKSNG